MNQQTTSNRDIVKYVHRLQLSHICSSHINLYYISRDLLKGLIILLPLLGITWIIGILAVNEETQAFAWIFAIFNSLQVLYKPSFEATYI